MIRRLAVVSLIVLACSASSVIAQEPAKPVGPARSGITAVMVDVTLARYLGEKRLSGTPYTLAVVPDNRSSLRMGGEVPVPSTTFTPSQKEDGKPATPLTSYGYRTVGTNIDVLAQSIADGQYRLSLTVEDSSIYPPDLAPATTKSTGAPAFRSFKSSNVIALRDGQSLDYTMATDRLTGEVYRVTVKLTVVK
jgi:Flp pilus assembly secretin CpaC